MIIIPIGSDCRNTLALKNNNYRDLAYPFDWIVTYD